jgi:hypothetical protein
VTSPLERAEQAVTEAEARMTAYFAQAGLSTPQAAANVTALVKAVEARYEARLRVAAAAAPSATCPGLDGRFNRFHDWRATGDGRMKCGYCPAVRSDLLPPADVCPLHSPAGDPCACGHGGGADCHPAARRAT